MTTPEPVRVAFTMADLEVARSLPGGDEEITGAEVATLARVDVRLTGDEAAAVLDAALRARHGGHQVAGFPPGRITGRRPCRYGLIGRRRDDPAPETVAGYLPGCYALAAVTDGTILIWGHDVAGFTLDATRDRLASGLIGCTEITRADVDPGTVPALPWEDNVIPLSAGQAADAIKAGAHAYAREHGRHHGVDAALLEVIGAGLLVVARYTAGEILARVTAKAVARRAGWSSRSTSSAPSPPGWAPRRAAPG